nr:thiamine pyrophosphate-dependent enzyme [Micromonospora sp. HNM0581]
MPAAHRKTPVDVVVGPAGPPGSVLPYAVAAKLAAPQRPVIVLVTDEGMRSQGLAELVTVSRWRSVWPDPRLVVLVFNERSGHPRRGHRPMTDDVPYAGWARLLGLHGVRVDRPELVGAACDEALNADRPCVLEVVRDALTFGSWHRQGLHTGGDVAAAGDGRAATVPVALDGEGAPVMAGWPLSPHSDKVL